MKRMDRLRLPPRHGFPSGRLTAWVPLILAALGFLLYLAQAWRYAHTNIPGLDEGSYLYKGYLFATGVYRPFQPYGPLTNKAPLAFLIPGWVQLLFGAGLRSGRLFALLLGALTVLGTWILARRWAGAWLAAAAVWVFALSPAVIKIHAIAASEVIIASMLVWMLVLLLAPQRSLWQILAGALLSALVVLTRQNMLPVVPLIILYSFWQHGWRKGLAAFLTATLVIIAVHAWYWPHILTIWAPWLPASLTPFLDPFRLTAQGEPYWNPSNDFWNRVIAFFQGIRYHFVPFVGALFASLLLTRQRGWKNPPPLLPAALLLSLLYLSIAGLHAWASIASQYDHYSCVYCFTAYLTFIDPLGLLLVVMALAALRQADLPAWQQALVLLLFLLLAVGVGLSSFDNLPPSLLNLPLPRMRAGRFLPGSTLLVDLLSNKFGWEVRLIKRLLAAALGLAGGLLVTLFAFLLQRRLKRPAPAFGVLFMSVVLAAALLLSPILNLGIGRPDCQGDLIADNEALGAYLAAVIPADSLVYWDGGLSFVPMIYVPQARIFPPQINNAYTRRIGGDPQVLYRFSHWNDALIQDWTASADIFIIATDRFAPWKETLNPQDFEEYPRPPAAPSCQDGAGLRIFHRLP